jgi:type IV secretion system protein VirB6
MATYGFYKHVGDSISNFMTAISSGAIGGTIDLIATTILLMVTIYYVVIGYQIMSGAIQHPLADFIKSGIKFMLISTFALSAVNYGEWIAGSITNFESGIASAWSGTSGSPYDILDTTLDQLIEKGNEVWAEGASKEGLKEIGNKLAFYALAILVYLTALVVTIPAAAMIICAKATLMLLIGVGPLFVVSLMFPLTSKWFDAWLSQVFTQIFTIGFICMIVSAAAKIFNSYLDNLEDVTVSGAIILLGVAILLMWLMYRAGQLGAGLAGGVSSSAITFGAMAATAMGIASPVARTAKKGASALNRWDKGKKGEDGKTHRKSAAAARYAGGKIKYAYQAGMNRWQNRNQGGSITPS